LSGAGLAFGTSEYRQQADAYLQQRLQSIYRFALVASALFLGIDLLSSTLTGWADRDWPKYDARIIHVIGLVLLIGHYAALRRRAHTTGALRYFDGFLVVGSIATCLGIYAVAIEYPGALRLIWIASLFVVGRGIAVPSSAWCTFQLSL
jgi:hypothetical protein